MTKKSDKELPAVKQETGTMYYADCPECGDFFESSEPLIGQQHCDVCDTSFNVVK